MSILDLCRKYASLPQVNIDKVQHPIRAVLLHRPSALRCLSTVRNILSSRSHPQSADILTRLSGKEEFGGRYERFPQDLKKYEDQGLDPSEANRRVSSTAVSY